MIIPAEGVVTFDVPQNAVDVSSLFYEIQIPGARFLNSIALGDSIRSVDPKWFDDRRLAIGTTISSAYVWVRCSQHRIPSLKPQP